MSKVSDIISDLKDKGYKNSFLRSQILEILDQSLKPLSAREMLVKLSLNSLKPNKTTIYRELEMLSREGFLVEITALQNSKLYELNSNKFKHHHHLVCTLCKNIQCTEIPENLNILQNYVYQSLGFKIESHIMEFFGKCAKCNINSNQI